MADEQTGDTGLNIDESVASIASDLGLSGDKEKPEIVEDAPEDTSVDETTPEITEEKAEEVPLVGKPAPKSWAKEKHEVWAKMPPEAQEYYEQREKQMLDGLEQYKGDSGLGKQIKEIMMPYQPILQAQNIDGPTAVKYLLNAHYKLTQGSVEDRHAAFENLGRELGLLQGETTQVDPTVRALQQKLSNIENHITSGQQKSLQEVQARTAKEVEAFATDPKHVYFDEVADDIVAMIQAGKSLDEAYEKAVWANPVSRQKEIARTQTETKAALEKKAKEQAEIAKKASSTNVRSRETRRSPTEPKGTIEDTMKDTLREIHLRTH